MSKQEPDFESIVPAMTVNMPAVPQEGEKRAIVSEESLLGIYGEILGNLREERSEMSGYISNLADMVFNDGDTSSSTKEALINLIKTKSDASDKMAKIADLMTRVVLKERDTFPKYLAASQNNTININDSEKQNLLKAINKLKKKQAAPEA